MQEIRKAIYNKFVGDADLKATVYGQIREGITTRGTRLFFTEAPQNVIFPYVTFHKVSGIPEYTFTSKMEGTLYQFTCFSSANPVTEIEDIFTKLTDVFDYAVLTFENSWTHVCCTRDFDNIEKIDNVWHCYIRYRIQITKAT